jgi:hypothetical protein
MLAVAVSGSFHRHMDAITAAVYEFATHSVRVLSPADPRVVAAQGEFLFVASDRVRSVRLVQDRHLEAIRAADFLWLVCPDGYVGQSASMEIGFAAGAGIPIFSTGAPADLTLREYVTMTSSIQDAIRISETRTSRRRVAGLLIDPHPSIDEAHAILERIRADFLSSVAAEDQPSRIYRGVSELTDLMSVPTTLH